MRQKLIWQGMQVIEKMERETGLEPATSSLGKRLSIGNKEHCVSWHLVLAIENTQFSLCALFTAQTEHKRSTRIDLNSAGLSPGLKRRLVCPLRLPYVSRQGPVMPLWGHSTRRPRQVGVRGRQRLYGRGALRSSEFLPNSASSARPGGRQCCATFV